MSAITKSKKLGTILFYLCWPLVWFYAPLRVRVRTIIEYNGKVIVVKNWFGPNSWQLPGGGIKIGESSLDTGIREVKEELNIDITEQEPSLITELPVSFRQSGIIFRYQYVFVKLVKKPEITLSDEVKCFDWIYLSEVKLPKTVRQSI